jgi:DNA (cytosine-5)-methyltransferase 1
MSKPQIGSLTSIDLFAGCGGLTRGLEWAGFECKAFNEINKDAADSFSINFPEALRFDGDVRTVLSTKEIRKKILPIIGGKGGLDLLCGGPPCQGYSGIGHRRAFTLDKIEIPTNHLFKEMIRVINAVKPKVFLFENVEGILSSTWIDYKESNKFVLQMLDDPDKFTVKKLKVFAKNFELKCTKTKKAEIITEIQEEYARMKQGKKGEIFRDVLAEFHAIRGYTAQPTLVHAYGFGVPQNRPRVMIMGVKNSILKKLKLKPTPFIPKILSKGKSYSPELRNNGGFFPTWEGSTAPNLVDVLSDLEFDDWSEDELYHRFPPHTDFQKLMRKELGSDVKKHSLTDHFVSNHSQKIIHRFQYMIDNGISNMRGLPEEMRTKKFSQKLLPKRWGEEIPSITCCSNSDDYIHYSMPRALSVREWARLQTFPDHHIFSGARTTGGIRRAGNPALGEWEREVPRYTQIGNAVPPLLAHAIGNRIAKYLTESKIVSIDEK